DEAVLLVRVAEDAGGPFGEEEPGEVAAEASHPGEIADPPAEFAFEVGRGLLGRGLDRDLGEEDPGHLELALVGAQLIGGLRLEVDSRPALGALGRRPPAGRLQEDALLDGRAHATLGLTTGPGPSDRPRLEVGVRKAILPEPVPGPVAGPGQTRRAGEPRA